MNLDSVQIATLVQIARLYYEDNLSQQEIADQLGVSRSLIALHLKKAREQNIVRIEIIDPQDECEDLALALKDKTGVRKVTVVRSSTSPALTRRALGGAVARYLESRLQDGDLIGFGWGRTIMEVVDLLAPSRPRKIQVVPLLGESSYTGSYTQMNQIVLQVAKAFGGQPYFLLAPMLVGSRELRDALLSDEVARDVAERWERLNIACVGIGSLPPTPGQILYIGEENVRCFLEDGAVGDICARYFNIRGEMLFSPLNERLVGISPESLRKARTLIAVAGGVEKARAVIGALCATLVTDLFIDEELGKELLAEINHP